MEDRIVNPDYVRQLSKFTDGFLCDLGDNIYNIKFLSFRVRDMDSGFVLFEVNDDEIESTSNSNELNGKLDNQEESKSDSARTIRYHLGSEFLELKNLATSLKFSVGDKPVKNLVMIERHYFKEILIKSFEFKFDFCMPNTVNTWETIYTLPELDEEIKIDMINSPWETKSDSFYFVDNKIIMHHKAFYNYSD